MPRHFGDLDANVVLTPALTTAMDEVRCALDAPGPGIFRGDPRTGKDFAIEHALEQLNATDRVILLHFSHAPRELELCHELLAALGEEQHSHEHSSRQLKAIAKHLAEQRRPVYVKEAQHWSRTGFGALRQLFDESGEAFPILMSGSEDFEDKLRRYQCLDGRKVAGQEFKPMTHDAALEHVPRFHRLYRKARPEAIGIVDQAVCKGRWGHWAAMTKRLLAFNPSAQTLTVSMARELVRTIRRPS